MAGFRSLLIMVLAGVVPSLLLPALPRQKLDLDLVKTSHGLSVMRHEVTIGQWRACIEDGGCDHDPTQETHARDDGFPVTGIGALDAQAFVAWAQRRIDPTLRLPSLEEWYAFSGIPPAKPRKIFTDPRLAWAATYGTEGKIDPTVRRSGSFGSNSDGVADVRGSVWEWTGSCAAKIEPERCPIYFAVGEHEARVPIFVREPANGGCATGTPPAHLGFRLVREN